MTLSANHSKLVPNDFSDAPPSGHYLHNPERSFHRSPVIWAGRKLLTSCAICWSLVSCAPSSPPKASPGTAQTSSENQSPPLKDKDWARFESKRFHLSISLPSGPAWKIDDHTSSWLVATHPKATLSAKLWRERRPMSRVQCEKKLREQVPTLPVIDSDGLVDDRPLPTTPAPDFDTRIRIGITDVSRSGEGATGVAMAVGAAGRHCFAMVITSEDHGKGAIQRLGDTLELTSRVIEGTKWMPLAPKAGVQTLP